MTWALYGTSFQVLQIKIEPRAREIGGPDIVQDLGPTFVRRPPQVAQHERGFDLNK